jgi:alkanesulfonate monooxygenase SsuD/methylene tetrahydromethanopterin reductase-like flavin-dependent oxidoreductase (luciferase family)
VRILTRITTLTRRTLDGAPGGRITYRDLIDGIARQGAVVVGDPIEVADHLQLWFETGAADGFNVFPDFVPGSVDAFTRLVVPELQRRGLFRTEYEGRTFREHLGLSVPVNRFATEGAAT